MAANGEVVSGRAIYVAKAEKKEDRIRSLKKSIARTNVYIRNFDLEVSEEQLKEFFTQYGKVKNVRIMVTQIGEERKSKGFGFVCFEEAVDAAKIVELSKENQLTLQGRNILANFYETKEERVKKLEGSKFGIPGMPVPDSKMNQMFMTLMNKFSNQYGNMFANPSFMRGRGGFRGAPAAAGRGRPPMRGMPGPPPAGMRPPAMRAPTQGPPPQGAPPSMAQGPPPMADPKASAYESKINALLASSEFQAADEEKSKELVGEVIYHPIAEAIGDELAPKITGMIIDMPKADLIAAVNSFANLQGKIKEGQSLLSAQA